MMRKSVLILLAAFVGVSLSACNTVAGMGKDIEKAGETISGAAKK
ncbi:entericidin A/B family lipoprotein [Burkholderiaceae bacterium FT117]|nr:entericidin A/B family lipoprotein [Zeimonas sediminis]MCM5569552.1 entericidin A/B family lipoprotein [Zeimonas sediminis]